MAHNLTTRADGTTEMFSAGQASVWHGLGKRVTNAATWKQAMKLASIDWTVSKRPLYDRSGAEVAAWGVFRDDNNCFLGQVGERYVPIQNSRIRHMKSCDQNLDLVAAAMQGVRRQMSSLEAVMNALAGKQLSLGEIDTFLLQLFPDGQCPGKQTGLSCERRKGVLALYELNDKDTFVEQRGTAYNLFNAVTAYVDHNMPVRGAKTNPAARAQGALFGMGESLKFLAITELAQLAGVADLLRK